MKLFLMLIPLTICACSHEVQSISGTKMAVVDEVSKNKEGHTLEQESILNKIKIDSKTDIWYLYVISPVDRKLILFSTVKGKVTSSGKRLTPKKTTGSQGGGLYFKIKDDVYFTDEILGEDGTYGESSEYLYWVDSKDRNHRHYLLDGQIIHIVDYETNLDDLLNNR